MALFERKKDSSRREVTEMTAAERSRYTVELERLRMDCVREMEAIMSKVAKDMKRGKLARRKFPVGKSPNDYTR